MGFESITILGGRGMLGSDLAALAVGRGLSVRVFDLPEFEITDAQQVEAAVSKSEVIVNCAAYTNVEKAESDIESANQINGYAVGRLGQIAKEAAVPVLHISTDFVFDGKKEGPYLETDATGPLSVYGTSKLLGEKLLSQSGCEYCIVRVQWTYGAGGDNFVTKILAAAEKNDELNVVDDQVGSPTSTLEVANVLCDLLTMDEFPTGTYHLAARGYANRFEMTQYLFDRLGIKTKVCPCKSSDYKTAAQRPLNSCFNCAKLEGLLGRPMPTWQEMLNNYLTADSADLTD
jgi:dTDP-4-dehydrorhamnose reductase